jgi:hypothetical protein
MKQLFVLTALAGVCLAGQAAAYEYPLQLSTPANTRGTTIAGYAFKFGKVNGDCSYYTVTSGSGRDPRSYTTHFYQGCTWDLHGNLLSIVQGEPIAPTPISSVNGLTIYAKDAKGDTTGVDTAVRGGFVNTPSAQFTWLTASGGYVFLSNQQPIDVTLNIQNVGDLALIVRKIVPTVYYAKVSVKSSTCTAAPVASGASCTIVITYDPSAIPGGDDPYTAYDHLTVGLVSNSGQSSTFGESIEVPIAPGG